MEPQEAIPFPHPNRYSDTPESIQECLSLMDHIDTLLTMWRYAAHHPSATPLRTAELINSDCAPPQEPPEDFEAQTGYGGKYTREQAKYLSDRDQARRGLAPYIDSENLDKLHIEDAVTAQYVDVLETFSKNPMAPDTYKQAVVNLRRIIVLREQISEVVPGKKQKNSDSSEYIEIIIKLAGSLF